jgi:hypothetical protein
MKVTQQQLLELAKTIGLKDVELVDDEKDSEYDSDTALQAIDASREPIIKTKFDNDIEQQANKAATGRALGTLKAVLKRWSGAEEKMFTKDMTPDQMVETALAHYTSTLDQDKGEAQKQLDEILARHQQERTQLEETYKSQLSDAHSKLTRRDIMEYIGQQMKDAPLRKGYDKNVAVEDAYNHLNSIYDLQWDEKEKKVNLIDKNTKLSALNDAGTLAVNPMDKIRPYFESRGAWATDMRDADAVTPTNQNGTPYQGKQQNGIVSGKSTPQEQSQARLAALQQVVQPQQ